MGTKNNFFNYTHLYLISYTHNVLINFELNKTIFNLSNNLI